MAHKNISDMEDLKNTEWSQMATILDKEMPVKKKNNRVLFWWMGSAAAITLLVIGLTLKGDQSTESTSQTIQESTPNNNNNNNTLKKEILNTDKENPIIAKVESTIVINSKIQYEAQNPSTLKLNTSRNNRLITVINKSYKSNSPPLKEIIKDLEKHKEEALSSQFLESNNKTNSANYKKEIFTVNPIAISVLTPILSKKDTPFTIPLLKIKNGSKLIIGVQTHYARSFQRGYSEIGAGIIAAKPISNRWSLTSSLNFNVRNKLLGNQSINELTADLNGSFSSVPDPFDAVNDIKLKQLTLQLGLQYQLNSKWAMNGSIIPSYSIVKYDDRTESLSASSSSFDLAFSESLSPKKWNTHIDLGLSYSLTDQIALGLNYSYSTTRGGLGTLIDPNFESDEWRFSVQYLLD